MKSATKPVIDFLKLSNVQDFHAIWGRSFGAMLWTEYQGDRGNVGHLLHKMSEETIIKLERYAHLYHSARHLHDGIMVYDTLTIEAHSSIPVWPNVINVSDDDLSLCNKIDGYAYDVYHANYGKDGLKSYSVPSESPTVSLIRSANDYLRMIVGNYSGASEQNVQAVSVRNTMMYFSDPKDVT